MESTQKAKKIGITGSIGSGKTTVCRIFEFLGAPVYYADDRAKLLMVKSPEIVTKIKNLIGPDAYNQNNELNREMIAQAVFKNTEKLKKLNEIVHPAVFEDSENWFKQNAESPYCIKEAALLIESGGYKFLDKLIVVTAPESKRIERVIKRDGLSKKQILARIQNQMPESEKIKFADYIIRNDSSISLINQVLDLHRTFLLASA